jgi:outer membrane protein OmpA-like peptidoglycan-associated protein
MGEALTGWKQRSSGGIFLWLLLTGILVSVIVHAWLWSRAKDLRVMGFSAESYDRIVPRTFRMKHVEIDPKAFRDPTPPEAPKKKVEVTAPADDHPVSQVTEDPSTAPLMKAPGTETPVPVDQGLPSAGTTAANVLTSPDIGTKNHGIPDSTPQDNGLPSVELPEPATLRGTGTATPLGFSSLDDLLAGQQPVTSRTPPILMPTDLLFEYDSDVLRQEAAESLGKLGSLIRKNSGSRFRIEGHTDSFGKEAYNQALSLRRAEAVKTWLVKCMGVNPSSVSAVGLGTSHPLAPITGTIAEQRLNRRVEIVISAN